MHVCTNMCIYIYVYTHVQDTHSLALQLIFVLCISHFSQKNKGGPVSWFSG